MPTADVLPFRRSGDPLASRGIALFSPGPGSRAASLRPLYRIGTGPTELAADPDRQLELVFDAPLAVRVVAMNVHVTQPPLGFALAVPVATPQELADALAVNRFDPHVRVTLERSRSWALLVAVHAPVCQVGIGRALANRALDGIRDAGGERVYVAARACDAWLSSRLLDLAFSRDGVTRETHPRTLFSRDANFTF